MAARCVWSIKFDGDLLSKKDNRSAFIQVVSKQMMLPLMKSRIQNGAGSLSRELFLLIKSRAEGIEPSSSSHQPTSRPGMAKPAEPRPSTSRAGQSRKPKRKRASQERQAEEQEGQAERELKKKARCRCAFCPWRRDRKVSQRCQRCNFYICPEHSLSVCPECVKIYEET